MDTLESVDSSVENFLGVAEVSTMDFNMRPSYIGTVSDSTGDVVQRLSEFDEKVRKNIESELIEVEEAKRDVKKGERITAYLRIRPLSKSCDQSQIDESNEIFKIEDPHTLLVSHQPRSKATNKDGKAESRFVFTKVLGPENTQNVVFDECMCPVLERFFQGENSMIFSYGATNSGKTFTMQGYGVKFGVIPRTLDYLFNRFDDSLYKRGNIKPNESGAYFILEDDMAQKLEEEKQKILTDSTVQHQVKSFNDSFASFSSYGTSSRSGRFDAIPLSGRVGSQEPTDSEHQEIVPGSTMYCIWISFAELYNEKVYDMLDGVKSDKKRELKLVRNAHGSVYVQDLKEYCAKSPEEAYHLFLTGRQNLHSAKTNMNAKSSRSHSFFNIRMVTIGATGTNIYPKQVIRLTFCDLAGIERTNQTKNEGIRLKESGSINNSLMVLLRCIRAIKDEQVGKASVMMPFRDSKLTRLFQSYLTTASRICMIASINPDPEIVDSTLQILQNCAVTSEVRTFHKVEAPENHTKFGRRVRASLLLLRNPKNNRGLSPMSAQSAITSDDGDSDLEYGLSTVVSKKPINSMAALRVENDALKEKIRRIEADTRDEMQRIFDKINSEKDTNHSKIHTGGKLASQNLSRRRISLQAKLFVEHPEALTSPNQNENESPCSRNETLEETVIDQFSLESDSEADGSKDPNPQYSALLGAFDDLKEVHNKNVLKLANVEAVIGDSENVLDLINSLVELGYPVQGLKDQHSSFCKSSQSQAKSLMDAETYCIQLHDALSEANGQLECRTKEVNDLDAELKRLREEHEYLHMEMSGQKLDRENEKQQHISDLTALQTEISELKSTIEQLNSHVTIKKRGRPAGSSARSLNKSGKRRNPESCSTGSKKLLKRGKMLKQVAPPDAESTAYESFDVSLNDDEEEGEAEAASWKPEKSTPYRLRPTTRSTSEMLSGFTPILGMLDGPAAGRRSAFKAKSKSVKK